MSVDVEGWMRNLFLNGMIELAPGLEVQDGEMIRDKGTLDREDEARLFYLVSLQCCRPLFIYLTVAIQTHCRDRDG